MKIHLNLRQLYASLLLLILISGCTPLTTLRQHPDFETNRAAIERVAVLPPTVKVERVMFSGDSETIDDKQDSYPGTLTTQANNTLNKHGYAVSKVSLIAGTDRSRSGVSN
jgi:hypothetical protein